MSESEQSHPEETENEFLFSFFFKVKVSTHKYGKCHVFATFTAAAHKISQKSHLHLDAVAKIQTFKENQDRVTVNNERSRAAASSGHHVSGHAGVVSGVGESGLFDDQVMINGDQEVGVL